MIFFKIPSQLRNGAWFDRKGSAQKVDSPRMKRTSTISVMPASLMRSPISLCMRSRICAQTQGNQGDKWSICKRDKQQRDNKVERSRSRSRSNGKRNNDQRENETYAAFLLRDRVGLRHRDFGPFLELHVGSLFLGRGHLFRSGSGVIGDVGRETRGVNAHNSLQMRLSEVFQRLSFSSCVLCSLRCHRYQFCRALFLASTSADLDDKERGRKGRKKPSNLLSQKRETKGARNRGTNFFRSQTTYANAPTPPPVRLFTSELISSWTAHANCQCNTFEFRTRIRRA